MAKHKRFILFAASGSRVCPDQPQFWEIAEIRWSDKICFVTDYPSHSGSFTVVNRCDAIAIDEEQARLVEMKKRALTIADEFESKLDEARLSLGNVCKARRVQIGKIVGRKL